MLRDFYLALAHVSFTLLGLWVVVVQTRHSEWRRSADHRRRGYAVWLQFALPGLMSLLSLVDPNSQALWRVSFGVVALAGVAILTILQLASQRTVYGTVGYAVAAALYALVALIAIAPDVVNTFDSSINAVRAEAILLSLLIFVGVNIAWFLLFDDTPLDEEVR